MTQYTLNRRNFIQLAGAAASLTLLPRGLYGFANESAPDEQAGGQIRINFAESTDVLICGSTLFACDLAIRCAKAGKKTTLVMDRVNPFFEGLSCLRPWVAPSVVKDLPAMIQEVLNNPLLTEQVDGRIYYNALKTAKVLDDHFIEAGVHFLYNTPVAGALSDQGKLAGVVFGGKMGLMAVEAGVVVDATIEATVARAFGHVFEPVTGPRKVKYVTDFLNPVSPRSLTYTAANGLSVKADINYYYTDYEMEFASDATGPLAFDIDYNRVYAAALELPFNSSETRLRGADAFLHSGIDRLKLQSLRGAENLVIFGPHSIPGNKQGSLVLLDPLALFNAFPDSTATVLAAIKPVPAARTAYEFMNKAVPAEAKPNSALSHGFRDQGFEEPRMSIAKVKFTVPVPLLQTANLVVGGGTSGNAAAYTSAQLGIDTVCLERGMEMGGTNTLGLVNNLWYGNETKAFEAYFKALGAKNQGLNAPGFYKGVTAAGCRIIFQSAVTGIARMGRNVTRVYLTTTLGLAAVESSYIIDATGDGCIAAWAGNAYSFGGERDEMTMVASLAVGLKPPAKALPYFTTLLSCDERSAFDITRFIVAMRQNSTIPLDRKHFPAPFFVATRESRHIRGGKTLTYLDVLSGRRFSDAVLRVESIPDIKGLATGDAVTSGMFPTDWKLILQTSVPYAALIPTSLDNIIVAGKAYSVTHDALCVARMQRDLASMGMVAAEAISQSSKQKVILRDISIGQLQATLIEKSIMPADAVAADDYGFNLSAKDAAAQVDGANIDKSLVPSAILALMANDTAAGALKAYAQTNNPSVRRIQAFIGMKEGVDHYVAEIKKDLAEPQLTKELFGRESSGRIMPDQGFAPIPAIMIGSLVATRQPQAVPLLVELGNRLELIEHELRSNWGYLYSLSCGFERLPCVEGRAPLKRVLAMKLFKKKIIDRQQPLPKSYDAYAERYTYLKMALSRALLRCGDPQGADELVQFLDEQRVWIARAARAELYTATGQDFGFNAEAWTAWLQKNSGQIKINPLTQRFV